MENLEQVSNPSRVLASIRAYLAQFEGDRQSEMARLMAEIPGYEAYCISLDPVTLEDTPVPFPDLLESTYVLSGNGVNHG